MARALKIELYFYNPVSFNSNTSMLRKTLPALAILASVTCAGAQSLTTPYKPTGALIASLDDARVWAELYDVKAVDVPAAVEKAKGGQPPSPSLAGAIANWSIYFAVDKRGLAIPEKSSSMTRAGAPVEYEACIENPKPGDLLEIKYENANTPYSLALKATVVEQLAFGDESTLALDVSNPEECAKETHSRMFLQGTLSLYKDGALKDTREVLVQSIVTPSK